MDIDGNNQDDFMLFRSVMHTIFDEIKRTNNYNQEYRSARELYKVFE